MRCIFYLTELGLHFDTIIVLGMVLASLLNAFFYVSGISRDTSLLITSTAMATSYFISNHYINLSANNEFIYLNWVAYDYVTIAVIYFFHRLFKQRLCIATKYVFIGLVLNSLLCLGMYVDIMILWTREPWWFWYLYTASVNFIDVLMVAALIINRDFLASRWFYRKLCTQVSSV